jgi:hypothetical protein
MSVPVLDKLNKRGFEVRPDPPGLVVTYPGGRKPPPDTPELLAELRVHKAEVLAILESTLGEPDAWDECAARRDFEAAFDWADQVTPCGCWTWLLDNGHRRLQDDLDVAFDEIDHAFMHRDVEELSLALRRFRRFVQQAVDAYRIGRGGSISAACDPRDLG